MLNFKAHSILAYCSTALKDLEERDCRLEAAEQVQASLKQEAENSLRRCEDMRRSCDSQLCDLQVETARQLSMLRKRNDGLVKENDQLRGEAAAAAADLAIAADRHNRGVHFL
jgi:hypothetical protein